MSFISRGDPNRVFNSVSSANNANETPPLPPKRYKEVEDMYANVPNIRLTKKIRHDKEKQHDVIDDGDGDSDDESFDDVPQQQQQLQSITHQQQFQTQELCKFIF